MTSTIRTKALRSLALPGILCAALVGCTPPWQIRPGNEGEVPTVQSVVDNINQQIACAVLADPDYYPARRQGNDKLETAWQNFKHSQPVASVQLTLQVIQSEGLNPSFMFIAPYPPIPPSTMSSTQQSGSLGIQLDGSQQRQIILNYVLDFDRMSAHVYIEGETGSSGDKTISCGRDGKPLSGYTVAQRELEGDLGFAETIDAELVGLQASSDFGIWPAPPQDSNNKLPTTSFSTEAYFTVTEGLNGGPNWKLVHFQGPAGGSGSGSGGGSGSSSSGMSGGMSGGGGGGGQLLNFNRSTLDQALITFTPACAVGSSVNWSQETACSSPQTAAEKLAAQAELAAATKNLTLREADKQRIQEELNRYNSVAHPEITDKLGSRILEQKRANDIAIKEANEGLARAKSHIAATEAPTNSAAAKAAAAAYGATQNLLYRLNPALGIRP